MEELEIYYKIDGRLRRAVQKMEDKIQKMDWSKDHKIDPNCIYDLIDRLKDRMWDNCNRCINKALDLGCGYSLGSVDGQPVFQII